MTARPWQFLDAYGDAAQDELYAARVRNGRRHAGRVAQSAAHATAARVVVRAVAPPPKAPAACRALPTFDLGRWFI